MFEPVSRRQDAVLAMGKLVVLDHRPHGPSDPLIALGAFPYGFVDELRGFLGHAELSPGQDCVHVLRGIPRIGHLEIMDDSRAVEGHKT